MTNKMEFYLHISGTNYEELTITTIPKPVDSSVTVIGIIDAFKQSSHCFQSIFKRIKHVTVISYRYSGDRGEINLLLRLLQAYNSDVIIQHTSGEAYEIGPINIDCNYYTFNNETGVRYYMTCSYNVIVKHEALVQQIISGVVPVISYNFDINRMISL